jgi:5-hydroxyisourate hydrolase
MSTPASITTHVLDTARGVPASGLQVRLERRQADGAWLALSARETDADGRARDLLPEGAALELGTYRLTFETGAYLSREGGPVFYPEAAVTFVVLELRHHHIPLLLSPFGFSTYRGS